MFLQHTGGLGCGCVLRAPFPPSLAVDAVAEAGAAPGTAAAGLERPRAGNLHPPLPHGPALPCLRGGRGEGAAQAGQGMRHTQGCTQLC